MLHDKERQQVLKNIPHIPVIAVNSFLTVLIFNLKSHIKGKLAVSVEPLPLKEAQVA
jgi:hypothetical protein